MSSGSAEVYLRAGRAQAQAKNCANDALDQGSQLSIGCYRLAAIDWLAAEVAASSMSLAVSFGCDM